MRKFNGHQAAKFLTTQIINGFSELFEMNLSEMYSSPEQVRPLELRVNPGLQPQKKPPVVLVHVC